MTFFTFISRLGQSILSTTTTVRGFQSDFNSAARKENGGNNEGLNRQTMDALKMFSPDWVNVQKV